MPHEVSDWAATLRDAFEARIAEPPEPARSATIRMFLVVRAGERLVALPRADIARIGRTPAVTPVPGTAGIHLGVTVLDGRLLPVFALSTFLGGSDGTRAAVAVLAADAVALAFDEFTSGGSIGADEMAPAREEPFIRGSIPFGSTSVPVIDLTRVLAEIRRTHLPPRTS